MYFVKIYVYGLIPRHAENGNIVIKLSYITQKQ